jgi:hypothetical protein
MFRLMFLLSIALVAFSLGPSARAVEIQVEGLQDSIAQPPQDFSMNHCTLRKAIINANDDLATIPQCQGGSGADTIVFNIPGTITFARAGINEDNAYTGDLDIKGSLTIIGHSDDTVIDAADLDRIFHIVSPGITVTLVNIPIRNGTGLGGGGAILVSNGTLTVDSCTISGSFASGGDGGGIMVNGGTLNLVNSTVTGNIAAHHAGAIIIDSGTANITSSTIAFNKTSPGFTNLTGGIRNTGTTTLRNTIVAKNNPGGQLPNLDGAFNSLGHNIIGEIGNQIGTPTIVAAPGTGDQIDIADNLVLLAALANNGGPTPTHALNAGSIAIDKGHSGGLTKDQRGPTRPCNNPAIANAAGCDGADVGAFEVQGNCSGGGGPKDECCCRRVRLRLVGTCCPRPALPIRRRQ